ncbi:adenylyltransferase/cytidyltransferase family protein [Candidatus Kaiserbacteria bacterium]|nr:adenylyltransferase/cytidyltransferase family protein [Candidatus Kaiserbacteria bacterium]
MQTKKTGSKKSTKASHAVGRKEKWVAVSGGFDPLHIGHVRMLQEARKLGDRLVIILNNDNWLRNKKGFVFMPEKERMELLATFPFVDRVVPTDHKLDDPDRSVSRSLRKIKPDIFANGGDRTPKDAGRKVSSLNADQQVCKELGIRMVYGVGQGGKVQSSSWMVRDAIRASVRGVRPWGEFYGWNKGMQWYLKTLHIKHKKRLSLQYHTQRSEYWMLVEWDATATTGTSGDALTKTKMVKNELFHVPLGTIHRLESAKGGVLVEIAIGEFDENDIIRLEDDFGRHKSA